MRELMRKLAVIAALCAALPLAAQDKPQGAQPKPAAGPTLEKAGMAAPDAKSEKPAKPTAPKTGNLDNGKNRQEIISPVKKEKNTPSEDNKTRPTPEEK